MDVTFSNMLEGTRQYFMGLPKQAQGGNASNVPSPWSSANTAPRSEELMPAPDSGQPTSSMPAQPPRPPSEPIEPEPHIIHKATVMREAAEKRREQPDPDDEEDPGNALSPPSHIIHKPPAHAPPASPAAAPQVPSPSPVRPPSAAALTLVSVPASTVTSMATSTPVVQAAQSSHPPASQHEPTYRPPTQRVQTPSTRPPDHFAPGRPPDPYSATRPPETYVRYHYESNASDVGASTRGPPVMPSQQSASTRHSPQTYAKRASSMPQHTSSRLRDAVPSQRYVLPTAQHQPPLNDRVPPIHHPHMTPIQRVPSADGRAPQYQPLSQHREPSPYSRGASSYDRHPAIPQRKYDPQQAYPGYRPLPSASQAVQSQRIEPHHHVQYKHTSVDTVSPHYAPPRPLDRAQIPSSQTYSQIPPHEIPRHPAEGHAPNARKPEYPDTRTGSYHYPTPSTSAVRYAPNPSMPVAPVPVVPSSPLANRTAAQRPGSTPKTNYEYPTTNNVPTSPARSAVKPAYPNQTRMTVSVTSLVNQMNQTKQKRESPLDLSVKTVKNSADSSTTQDDLVDSATAETTMTPVQSRPTSSSRNFSLTSGYIESHKVDFAPDFKQYRERSSSSHVYNASMQPSHHTARFNGTYDPPLRPAENYPVESRQHAYDRSKSSAPSIPRIDLTRSTAEERRPDNRIRDDRNFLIEERKRPTGPIVNNIPDKMVRYETWTADSRISDRMIQSAREQHELMSRPVYSYSSHKQFEAYQNEQKRIPAPTMYRDHHAHFPHRYPVHADESSPRERHDYHTHYSDRVPSNSNRHVIQKVPSHRDIHSHHLEPHNGVPADKRVLSILRNSLETKQTGFVEPIKPARQIPDLIVIDDVDDSVIEITDLTKDNETETTAKPLLNNNLVPNLGHHIQMPKAVDSIARDSDYQRFNNADPKSKSPENDVASRIRTKAELKVMPPSQDNSARPEVLAQNATPLSSDKIKPLPKSQKQHLFNQIRQDNLRIESVIKSDASLGPTMSEVKTEPMNIDEIEKDAEIPIKTEDVFQNLEPESANLNISNDTPGFDLDWDNACDSFMEQLKSGCHKKKTSRKRIESNVDGDSENKAVIIPKVEPTDTSDDKHVYPTILPTIAAPNEGIDIIIKQEPVDAEEMTDESVIKDLEKPESIKVPETTSENNSERKSTSSGADTEPVLSKLNKTCEEADPNSTTKLSPSKSEKTIKEFKDKIKESTKIKRKSLLGKDKDRNKVKQQSDAKETDKDHIKTRKSSLTSDSLPKNTNKLRSKNDKHKNVKKQDKVSSKGKEKPQNNLKVKSEKIESTLTATSSNSQITNKTDNIKTVIKEEIDSTDDDEPLIKSKIMKEKEMKYQLLKDLSQKSAYVKLECFDVDMNKNTRISIDSITKDKDEKSNKGKPTRQSSRTKGKSSTEVNKLDSKNNDSSSGSDDDDVSVASRLRLRKPIKTEDDKDQSAAKLPGKSSPKKQDISNISNSSTPIGKPGFGDGSDFHPGWEEELYRYKRSLRMPTRLIAIPRGRSGGPFVKGSGAFFSRGSTSLPDLDPAPLSPAPSSAPSAATDDLFARRPDKLALDSDLESNSSSSAVNRLQYDSEASTSTIFSSSIKKKANSIVDVLMKKCGKKDEKKKSKDKDDKLPKVIPKSLNPSELLPTPSLGLVKKDNKGSLSAKKEKLMEDIFYLGAFRKETVTAFRNAFIKNTDGLIGATEEFAPVVLKSRTRTESRVLKQRATIKEVFGDERPASAPPACRDNNDNDNNAQNNDSPPDSEERVVKMKKEPKDNDAKPKLKSRKLVKDKLFRRSNSIRDGLRSTISLKRNDAKGRLLRLKKRNSLMKSLATKRMKHLSNNKIRKEKLDDSTEDNVNKEDKINKEEGSSENIEGNNKRRFKRLFGRRKFSSGFDYIRKKKKIRREENATTPNNRIRRPAVKPSPESVHDIHKEIKGWFINKSIGETHLHRAARLGYTDCVAYCLEKLSVDPSAKDNAGYTPLHFASAKGHVRIARLLLQYGADVSAAAQGGIRPLHEACENSNVEVIRLLLSYGADPLLGTYAGQTPEELTEGLTTRFLRLHIADVQGRALEPWRFPPPATSIDREELGCDPLSSPPPSSPPPPPDSMVEIQCTEAPLPPFYSLRPAPGQPTDGLWCLLQDVTNLLQIKSKESLLKQIHCGSGSPKELLREIRTQEFLERAQCHQLLGAGEKVNVRASKVALVRVTDKLRQLLKIETVLVS